MTYPALVERALRLLEARGQPVDVDELVPELFGTAAGPWAKLVERVLDEDSRVRRLQDGRFALRDPSGPSPLEAQPAPSPDLPAAGLVVVASGPKPWKDQIVAIGAARWCGDRLESDEWFVRPAEPCRLPAYLAKYGVTAEAVEEGRPLDRAVEALLDFVGDAPLAGLDVSVGVARLQYALRALGKPTLVNQLRELAIADGERPDLLRLARRAGLPAPERLRPANLASLAARLAKEGTEKNPPSLARRKARQILEPPAAYRVTSALDATAWRHLLDARMLASIPDAPGVYLFKDATDRLLYVGKATSLRARLASYLTGNFPLVRQMPGLVEATAHLDHEPELCELAARLREAELIATYHPPYNVQRRVEPVLTYAGLAIEHEPSEDGRLVPRLRLETAEAGVLTPLAAANAAFTASRRAWWPPRPKAAKRPSPAEVRSRLDHLVASFTHRIRTGPITDALRAEDLTDGLVVCAPERAMPRTREDPAEEEDGLTRERFDRDWPPRWLSDEIEVELAPPEPPRAPGWVALLVDPHGLRASAPIPEPTLDAARAALATIEPNEPPDRPDAGLASLSVLLAALRRGEPHVHAWPNRP
jgi:hypothetical protein